MTIRRLLEETSKVLYGSEKNVAKDNLTDRLYSIFSYLEMLDKHLVIHPYFFIDGVIYYPFDKDEKRPVKITQHLQVLFDPKVIDTISDLIAKSDLKKEHIHRAIMTFVASTTMTIDATAVRLIPVNLLSDVDYGVAALLFVKTSREEALKMFVDFDIENVDLLPMGTIDDKGLHFTKIPEKYWMIKTYAQLAQTVYFEDAQPVENQNVIVTSDEIMKAFVAILKAKKKSEEEKEKPN